jgi:hypothetical protein
MHSTLAVTPAGVSLGLLTQAFFTRPVGEPAHKPQELRKLPIEEKESYRWLEALEQTLTLAPPEVQVVTVCDREADIYEMFVLSQEKEADLLVRASKNRRLAETEVKKLWAKVEQQPVAGQLTVHIAKNQKQEARVTTVSVRFTKVRLKPPWRPNGKKLPPITLYSILVREDDPPDDVDEPIEWLLLINCRVSTFDDAVQVIEWYCCRWQIEIYHKIIKSGCRVEDCRLQTADRLQNYIALMSVIAWRLHWLTYINRAEPDLPCTVVLTAIEWQALYMRIHRTNSLPDSPPTVRQAVRWIAQLGGFLGRRRDGEPGITVIWRGWQRLQDIAAAEAVAACEENRRLLRQLAALRAPGAPRLSGVQALKIIGASMFLPRAEHSRLLRAFLTGAEKSPPLPGVRLFMTGSAQDHANFYELVESRGAVVVGEDHDWGNRHLAGEIDLSAAPSDAIVDRYHLRQPGTNRSSVSARVTALVQQVRATSAQGVIFYILEKDDAPSWDFPEQRKALEALGVPVLLLDRQPYQIADAHRLRRQIDAFVGSIAASGATFREEPS